MQIIEFDLQRLALLQQSVHFLVPCLSFNLFELILNLLVFILLLLNLDLIYGELRLVLFNYFVLLDDESVKIAHLVLMLLPELCVLVLQETRIDLRYLQLVLLFILKSFYLLIQPLDLELEP